MTMLGMQADMGSSYFPGRCSSRDLNLNASCSIWPLNSGDNFIMNGFHFNHNLNPLSREPHLSHKERLKKTMLQQEATFREQICELHRLYSRQKQLMNEVKISKLYGHHQHPLQLETSRSIPIMSECYEKIQKTHQVSDFSWLNPAYIPAFITASENLSYDIGKNKQVGCGISQSDVCVKERAESKCQRVGNKLLDLELPADEYIDNDEDESVARIRVPLIEGEEMPRYRLKSVNEDAQSVNEEWSLGKRDLNLVFQEDNMTQPPTSRKSIGLADLNEAIVLEESNEPAPKIDNVPSHITDYTTVSCQDPPGKTNLDTQVQPKEIIQNLQMRQACSNILDMVEKESQLDWTNSPFENYEAGQSSSVLDSFPDCNSEAFSISSGDSEMEQAHEVSTSNSLNNSSRESHSNDLAFGSVSSDDFSGLVAEACEYTSNQLVPLADAKTNESLLAPWRKHDNAFVRVPTAAQALPCFKISEGFIPDSGDNSHHRKNIKYKREVHCLDVQSNFSKIEVELVSDNACSEKHMKGSGNVKHIRNIDLNSMSPCSSSDAGMVVWITGGKHKLEDLAEPILCKRTKIELEPACLKGSRISILDDESKKVCGGSSEVVERASEIRSSDDPHNSTDQSHGASHGVHETFSGNDSVYSDEKDGLDCKSLDESGKQLAVVDVVVENLRDEILDFGSSIDLNSLSSEHKPALTICSVTPERDLEPLENPKDNESIAHLEVLASPKGNESPSQLEALANDKDRVRPEHLDALSSPKDNESPSQLEALANDKNSVSSEHLDALSSPKDNESPSQLEALANDKNSVSPEHLDALSSPKDNESPSQLEALANDKNNVSSEHLDALSSPKDNESPSQLEALANDKDSVSPEHLDALSIPKDNESPFHLGALARSKGSESLPYQEALASPKDNESPPLCIESDRNELETFSKLPGQGDGHSLEELISIAAEAIVSMSSEVQVQPCRESIPFKPSDCPRTGPLHWLSRIAISVVDEPGSEFGVVLSCKDTAHCYPSHGIDYFEAMTLQLKDTQVEEYCCKTNVATFPTSFPSQPKKGRTRRGRPQRKVFQSEVLPTEDLHVVGGLIEAARAGWNTGTRKGGRNGSIRRGRPSTSTPTVLPKLRTRDRECSMEKRLVDWGKITRRPRGARCPASNPWLVVTQV